MNELIEQLNKISEAKESAMQCGGTYSANNLRICLSLLDELEEYNSHPKYENILNALLTMKNIWQSALKRHNSNKSKFIEYDIETGLQIEHVKNA